MENLLAHPKALILALLGGVIPALLWLWFWLKEGKSRCEPKSLLSIIFGIGMLSVFFVLPIQQYIQSHIFDHTWRVILWAASEEAIKFLAAIIILYGSKYTDDPIDWPIFLITAALGFAALENTLFLIKPFSLEQTTVSLLTGHLRFLGSTLLHTVSSGAIGIAMGLSFGMSAFAKKMYLIIGFAVAIALHSAFNFLIIKNDGGDFLKTFAFLWVVTIIVMLLMEKLRRMSKSEEEAEEATLDTLAGIN